MVSELFSFAVVSRGVREMNEQAWLCSGETQQVTGRIWPAGRGLPVRSRFQAITIAN